MCSSICDQIVVKGCVSTLTHAATLQSIMRCVKKTVEDPTLTDLLVKSLKRGVEHAGERSISCEDIDKVSGCLYHIKVNERLIKQALDDTPDRPASLEILVTCLMMANCSNSTPIPIKPDNLRAYGLFLAEHEHMVEASLKVLGKALVRTELPADAPQTNQYSYNRASYERAFNAYKSKKVTFEACVSSIISVPARHTKPGTDAHRQLMDRAQHVLIDAFKTDCRSLETIAAFVGEQQPSATGPSVVALEKMQLEVLLAAFDVAHNISLPRPSSGNAQVDATYLQQVARGAGGYQPTILTKLMKLPCQEQVLTSLNARLSTMTLQSKIVLAQHMLADKNLPYSSATVKHHAQEVRS